MCNIGISQEVLLLNSEMSEFTAEELQLAPVKFEYLDHTADVQLHSWGDSLKEAFEQCGIAMFGYMTELDSVEITQCHEIEATADDLEGLLFHFLDELLFLFSCDPFLICSKVVITDFITEGGEFSIKCKCYGEEFVIGKHPQGSEVKAITYSAMQIVDEPEKNRSLQHSHLNWNVSSGNSNHGRGIRSGVRSPCTLARRKYGLVKIQAKLCRNSMEAMPHIQNAATLASETCRKVFSDRRWNCSSIIAAPFLTPDLTRATREQAYVYAISSAALTYTLAQACSSGGLHQCTCAGRPINSPNTENFQWGGCGDNVRWASQFAKRFIDNVEKHSLVRREKSKRAKDNIKEESKVLLKDEAAMINLHNNRVGRKVISLSLRTQCKCHGVSGSCNIKTCWKALPSMMEIGRMLLQKYTTAKEVSKTVVDRLEIRVGKKVATSDQLVYMSKSPDYCTKDDKLGSFGTIGRHCNVSSNGLDSCRVLCCGRGYRTVVEEKIERCQCKFYSCCYVKCKICRTMSQVYECS